MKIYLLSLDNRRFFFYADDARASLEGDGDDEGEGEDESGGEGKGESEADRQRRDARTGGPSAPRTARWWKRLLERGRDMRATWERSDSRSARGTRRAWDWLHSWSHPDHATLGRLRSARRIEIYYPASRPAELIEGLWDGYLARRWRRHLVWAIVNSIIAPVSVVFAILPGPNLIGYWFAYRAVHHALILWGLRRARRRRVPTTFHPLRSLDQPIARSTAEEETEMPTETGANTNTNAKVNANAKAKVKASHVALEGEAAKLEEHAVWSESSGCFLAPVGDRPADAAPSGPDSPDEGATSQP